MNDMKLTNLLKIESGVTSFIGGGGKTALIRALALELSREFPVIVTTSTKIYPPDYCPSVLTDGKDSPEQYRKKIRKMLSENHLLAVGQGPDPEGKLSSPILSFQQLSELAPVVLVEADGSKQLPLKAHTKAEPVIPSCSRKTVYVIGLSGVGKTIQVACHRPELYLKQLQSDITLNTILTPALICSQLAFEGLGDLFFLNQADSPERIQSGKEIARMLGKLCVIGNLQTEVYECLY